MLVVLDKRWHCGPTATVVFRTVVLKHQPPYLGFLVLLSTLNCLQIDLNASKDIEHHFSSFYASPALSWRSYSVSPRRPVYVKIKQQPHDRRRWRRGWSKNAILSVVAVRMSSSPWLPDWHVPNHTVNSAASKIPGNLNITTRTNFALQDQLHKEQQIPLFYPAIRESKTCTAFESSH
jgi:hypothetical protein